MQTLMTSWIQKINADEDVRVKTLSIGVVVPDKFIELAREDKDMYVFILIQYIKNMVSI